MAAQTRRGIRLVTCCSLLAEDLRGVAGRSGLSVPPPVRRGRGGAAIENQGGPETPDKSPRTWRSWSASRTLICTVSLGPASADTASTMTGSTVSNLPGQLSGLWGQDSQVPA